MGEHQLFLTPKIVTAPELLACPMALYRGDLPEPLVCVGVDSDAGGTEACGRLQPHPCSAVSDVLRCSTQDGGELGVSCGAVVCGIPAGMEMNAQCGGEGVTRASPEARLAFAVSFRLQEVVGGVSLRRQ